MRFISLGEGQSQEHPALRARQLLIGEVDLFALFFRKFAKFRAKTGKVIGMILLYGREIGFRTWSLGAFEDKPNISISSSRRGFGEASSGGDSAFIFDRSSLDFSCASEEISTESLNGFSGTLRGLKDRLALLE